MRRVVSLYLPAWPTDRLRRTLREAPARTKPLVTAERIGARRVVASVDEAAQKLVLKAGLALAHAQALVPDLAIAEARPEADAEALQKLAAWCGRYSPLVASAPPDGILVEVAGSAHLFGGEAGLIADAIARLAKAGIKARGAAADTPGAASALARFSAGIAAPGRTREAIEPLPVAALRLPAETAERLHRLGIERIAHLLALPRGPLARRFGAAVVRRLDQVLGQASEPLDYLVPSEAIRHRLAFAEPVSAPETLARVAAKLCAGLCGDLERAGLGVRQLDLVFRRVDNLVQAVRIGTARPTRDPAHLARLLGARLETVDPGFGIDEASLWAACVEPLAARQIAAGPLAGTREAPAGAELVDRLTARIGAQKLYRLAPVESDLPERSVRRVPPLAPPAVTAWPAELPRPSRLLDPPELVEATALVPDYPPARFVWRRVRRRVVRADGPERVFGEWWRADREIALVRDYYTVEDETGARYWLFRDAPVAEGGRWWLHGLFA